ncbi:MAG: hypothetical protein M0P12_01065 [Paludibacteraceae bacterium]|nr:hypothetical protein [Paludibacteraceae bacterium]MCK9616110.1 hypothetical protein [Candidatus Omnitrophota bacterium]
MQELTEVKKFVKKRIDKAKKKRVVKLNHPFSDLELLNVLRRVGDGHPISETKYKKDKKEGDPSTTLFWKRFGSFNNAVEMIYGKQVKDSRYDEVYFINLIIESRIKNQNEYLKKHKEMPDIFPSIGSAIRLFKNFGNLLKAAEHFNIKNQLMRCLEVKLAIKRCPRIEDYRDAGINTVLLLSKFVLISEINKRVKLLEEGYEIQRGNKLQTFEDDREGIERETKRMFTSFSSELRLQHKKKDS